MSGDDGPRGVQMLYLKVMARLKDACKEDFRSDGIDPSVLDTLLQLWFNSLKETRVMHDDQLGETDRKGQPRQQKIDLPPKPKAKPKEEISAEMKRQLEDIIMLAADAVVTPQLTQLLQQHSTDAMSIRPQLGSVKILQTHGWDGSRFLGRVDGKLLRKLADGLVVYIHRSTTEPAPRPLPDAGGAPPGGSTDAPASATAPGGTHRGAPTASAAAALPRIPQTDGAGGTDDDSATVDPAAKRRRTRYGEESSEDEEDAEDGAAAAASDGAAGESDLNSDDDDLLEEAEEETSLILCQYKRVKKSKNKYTLELQNGLMRVFLPNMGDYGREYVIGRAQANLDWGK
jgi:hypothetical protein